MYCTLCYPIIVHKLGSPFNIPITAPLLHYWRTDVVRGASLFTGELWRSLAGIL